MLMASKPPNSRDMMATFIMDEREFKFSHNHLLISSKKYRKTYKYSSNNLRIELRLKIDKNSFQIFLNACQNLVPISREINNDNVFHLLYLSMEWQVPVLIKDIQDYLMSRYTPDLRIHQILEFGKHGLSTRALEKDIANDIQQFIQLDEFMKIPQIKMYRILAQAKDINQSHYLDFLEKLNEEQGERISPYFQFLHADKLNEEELNRLKLMEENNKLISYFLSCKSDPIFLTEGV